MIFNVERRRDLVNVNVLGVGFGSRTRPQFQVEAGSYLGDCG